MKCEQLCCNSFLWLRSYPTHIAHSNFLRRGKLKFLKTIYVTPVDIWQILLLLSREVNLEYVWNTRKRKNGKKKLGNVSKSFRNKSACDTRVKVRGNSHRESTKSEKQDSKLRRNTITFCAQFCLPILFPIGETKLGDNLPI